MGATLYVLGQTEMTAGGSAPERVPRTQPTSLLASERCVVSVDVCVSRQDEYSILPYSFIIGVHGYVLVYSVTSLHR